MSPESLGYFHVNQTTFHSGNKGLSQLSLQYFIGLLGRIAQGV